MVPSTVKYSKSLSSAIAGRMRCQMPLALHRLNRRRALFRTLRARRIGAGLALIAPPAMSGLNFLFAAKRKNYREGAGTANALSIVQVTV